MGPHFYEDIFTSIEKYSFHTDIDTFYWHSPNEIVDVINNIFSNSDVDFNIDITYFTINSGVIVAAWQGTPINILIIPFKEKS